MNIESSTTKGERVARFYIFIFRIILGAAAAVILMQLFYPRSPKSCTVGLWGFLIGMAYLLEYFRTRK
jgi:hypothetical protein